MTAVDPVAVFGLRCEALAHLCNIGDVDLHDAADELQETAGELDQDTAQAIAAEAFRPIHGRELYLQLPARSPQSRIDASISAIVAAAFRRRGVPRATLDAADYMLACANDAELRRWLNGHQRHLDEILEHWRGHNDKAA